MKNTHDYNSVHDMFDGRISVHISHCELSHQFKREEEEEKNYY